MVWYGVVIIVATVLSCAGFCCFGRSTKTKWQVFWFVFGGIAILAAIAYAMAMPNGKPLPELDRDEVIGHCVYTYPKVKVVAMEVDGGKYYALSPSDCVEAVPDSLVGRMVELTKAGKGKYSIIQWGPKGSP